jgi:DNA polymerase (family 10)
MKRAATNKEIADVLREFGLIDEAEGVPFKPQAYESAADLIDGLGEELAETYRKCGETCIDDLPGIGESIAGKIVELVTTGRCKEFDRVKKKYPFDMLGLTSIPSVGPKTALTLYKKLKVKTLADLERVAKAGKVRVIPGFGRKTEDNILRGVGFLREHEGRFRLHDILPMADAIVGKLSKLPGVSHVEAAGSIRRRKETVGDIDLIMSSVKPKVALDAFTTLPEVEAVTSRGADRASVRYRSGCNGDLIVLPPENYALVLHHFTGNREHNVALRELAIKRGMKLSEYGLFKGKKRLPVKTEADIYQALGLDFIPPEIREDRLVIDAAREHRLPDLVGYGDVKGDLQVQTDWTDGNASIADMAAAAKAHGFSYIAITDHTQALAMAGGLDEKKLAKQGKEIDALNKKTKGFRILKSTECDIKKDGALDLADAALKKLDLVCVSVHSFFNLPPEQQTERIIRAFKNPYVNVFFHPTGRIVNARDPYAYDFAKVLRAAKEFGVALEVNGSERMDLRDAHVREAVEAGVKLVIDSDAHKPEEFRNVAFGIGQARRGWATKADVLNAKPADAFLKAIRGLKKKAK